MELLDLSPRRSIYERRDCFFEAGIRGSRGFEKSGSRDQEFAIQFKDFVEFSCEVAADNVLDANACRLDFPLLSRSQLVSLSGVQLDIMYFLEDSYTQRGKF